MIYEIVNPSDCYTMKADDLAVAQAAVIVLGQGQYGLKDEQGESCAPMLLFATPKQTEEILAELFGEGSLGGFIERNKAAIADALDSVMSVDRRERRLYEEALVAIESEEKRQEFRDKTHDRHRSSMNDIGGAAWEYAKRLRERD